MEFRGGEITVKRSHPGGEDRLSALPDDALVLILLHLDTATAGRTSVLARRWQRVWTLLPVLRFPDGADPHRPHRSSGGAPLPPREDRGRRPGVRGGLAVGCLVFQNKAVRKTSDYDGKVKAFELPCLENTTRISLDLWFLFLALPRAGTFARLTELVLIKAWFHEPSALGDLVSSPLCPSLQKLMVCNAVGLVNLAIHSESLLQVELRYLVELQQLIIDAPALKELKLHNNCFAQNEHTVDLSAPQLVSLELSDTYVPSSIQLGNIPLLQRLTTSFFLVYGPEEFPSNDTMLELLIRFRGIQDLTLNLAFPQSFRVPCFDGECSLPFGDGEVPSPSPFSFHGVPRRRQALASRRRGPPQRALPDDALVFILLRLDTCTVTRTSVLARHWRRVWTLLPVLRFPDGADPHRVRAALAAHQAALRYLRVRSVDAVPASVAAWLSAASRRLTGRLVSVAKAERPGVGVSTPAGHGIWEKGLRTESCSWILAYVIGHDQYLMEDITIIPRISFLTLVVMNYGHAFGASLFHVLKKCTGLRSLSLHFDGILEEQFACPSGCICDQRINWKTDKLLLSCLQEVEITNMNGADHEVTFLKQLFNWATALKNMRMVFHCSVSESRARELRQALSSFFGPETCAKFYIHGDDPKLLCLLR
ncbi:hypothetical protein EJB05_13915, partial [Eragrostis curvula]